MHTQPVRTGHVLQETITDEDGLGRLDTQPIERSPIDRRVRLTHSDRRRAEGHVQVTARDRRGPASRVSRPHPRRRSTPVPSAAPGRAGSSEYVGSTRRGPHGCKQVEVLAQDQCPLLHGIGRPGPPGDPVALCGAGRGRSFRATPAPAAPSRAVPVPRVRGPDRPASAWWPPRARLGQKYPHAAWRPCRAQRYHRPQRFTPIEQHGLDRHSIVVSHGVNATTDAVAGRSRRCQGGLCPIEPRLGPSHPDAPAAALLRSATLSPFA